MLANGPLTETLARLDLPNRQEEHASVVIEVTVVESNAKWHLVRAEFPGGSLWVRDIGVGIRGRVRLRVLARDVSLALEHRSILNLLPATVSEVADNAQPAVKRYGWRWVKHRLSPA